MVDLYFYISAIFWMPDIGLGLLMEGGNDRNQNILDFGEWELLSNYDPKYLRISGHFTLKYYRNLGKGISSKIRNESFGKDV